MVFRIFFNHRYIETRRILTVRSEKFVRLKNQKLENCRISKTSRFLKIKYSAGAYNFNQQAVQRSINISINRKYK